MADSNKTQVFSNDVAAFIVSNDQEPSVTSLLSAALNEVNSPYSHQIS